MCNMTDDERITALVADVYELEECLDDAETRVNILEAEAQEAREGRDDIVFNLLTVSATHEGLADILLAALDEFDSHKAHARMCESIWDAVVGKFPNPPRLSKTTFMEACGHPRWPTVAEPIISEE